MRVITSKDNTKNSIAMYDVRHLITILLFTFLFIVGATIAGAAESLLIDNFNDGKDPNELGGMILVFSSEGSVSSRSYCNEPENVVGGTGYSMKIDYDIKGNSWAYFYSSLRSLDAREYKTISLWVKGKAAGETFRIRLEDENWSRSEVSINYYLPNGIATEWQKVSIPLAAFISISDWNKLEGLSILFLGGNNGTTGTIYLDDIGLEKKVSMLVVDDFDGEMYKNAFGYGSWTAGSAYINTGYDTSNPYGGKGRSYRITYEATPSKYCIWATGLDMVDGVNLSSQNTLLFYIRGNKGGERPNVYLKDKFGHRKWVDIEKYITVSTNWQRVSIPLSDFSSKGVDLTSVTEFSLVFEWEDMTGTIYLDNIAFVNDNTPPEVSSPNPANGVISGSPIISVKISDGNGVGVDIGSIQLEVGGVIYNLSSPALTYDSLSETLIFMPYKVNPSPLVFTDGQNIDVRLSKVSDKAGNMTASTYSWSWVYDVDLDTTPPGPPAILSPETHITNLDRVVFTWGANDTSGIAGYSFVLNENPNTIVDRESEGLVTQKVYEISGGVYYFHVAAVDKAGNWSQTTHFELRVSPEVLLIDDFDDGTAANSLGSNTGTFDSGDGGSFCNSSFINDAKLRMGRTGYSLKLDYNVYLHTSFAEYWSAFSQLDYIDLSKYHALSLWVRGARGGEILNIGFEDLAGNRGKVNANHYLIGGLTQSWQNVVVPLSAFSDVNWDKIKNVTLTFEGAINSLSGTVYIDKIELLANYLPIDNFDAALPLGGVGWSPYWTYRVGDTLIDVGYDASSEAWGGSGHSLEIKYEVRLPAGGAEPTYCGLGRVLGKMDLSKLNMLGFYAKGASVAGGEHFNVYLNDGTNRTFVDIRNYLTVRNSWHYVKIPLVDFVKNNSKLNLASIQSLEILFEWENMSGTIYIDDIEFTNGLFKEPSLGPVKISGQELFIHGRPFIVKGVGYQPAPIGYYPYDPQNGSPYIDVFKDTPYNRRMWERDLAYLGDMKCNTIRTWGKVTSPAFLDACYNNWAGAIYVIMGIYLDNNKDYSIPQNRMAVIDEFAHYVKTYKDHPAVLMWAIGNEDNYWYAHKSRIKDLYTLINELAGTAYEIEGAAHHPVTFPSGDLGDIGKESVRMADTAMNYIDLWSVNLFRGKSFGNLFIDYQSRSTKPLLISEYGIDVWDNVNKKEYEDKQASYAVNLWNEIQANSNLCVGATIMAYSDEWWKDIAAGSAPDRHDYGGYPTAVHPDGFSNEEWWGIMRAVDNGSDIDIMQPRKVFYDLRERWTTGLLIDGYKENDGLNELGGNTQISASSGSNCNISYVPYNTSGYDVSGYSLKVDYDVKTDGFASYGSLLGNLDATKYNTLSFWVKGGLGGEVFAVGLEDAYLHTSRTSISNYLARGVLNRWQKVFIPLAAFREITNWNRLQKFSIIFDPSIKSGAGTIYVDDIKLDIRWVPYRSFAMSFDNIDVSSKDTLSFNVRGAKGGERPNVYLSDGVNRKFVDIEKYGKISTDWKRINIPLSDFSNQGVDLTHIAGLSFVFEYDTMSGNVYVDDIRFVNYQSFIMPTLNSLPKVTNTSSVTLSGNKASKTGILVNGREVIGASEATNWSFELPLVKGSNIIRVMAKDSENNESQEIITGIVLDAESPSAFVGPDQILLRGDIVYFDGSFSYDNHGIREYIWNFGDGSPEERGARVAHVYTTPGVYTAKLTVYDLAGNGPIIDEATITVEDDNVVKIGGPHPDFATIQEGIDMASAQDTVFVYPGQYEESLTIPKEKSGIVIKGKDRASTVIRGNIALKDTSATISNLTIFYDEGDYLPYDNSYYNNCKILADAGITAINSETVVRNCTIAPDPNMFKTNYGKGIQIWNLYKNPNIAPHIEGNLIQNADCGIYYFSQASGGAIYGEIKNNTFFKNRNGIILRMHRENPRIYNDIFDNSLESAIHYTYEDGELFTQRRVNIHNNIFNQNTHNFWLDSSQSSFDLIGIKDNIEEDPLFVAPLNGNFYLSPNSPALTGGEGGSFIGAHAEPPRKLFIKITSHADGETIFAEP